MDFEANTRTLSVTTAEITAALETINLQRVVRRVAAVETCVPIISGPIQDYTRYWLAGQAKESPARMKKVFAEAAWNAVRQ